MIGDLFEMRDDTTAVVRLHVQPSAGRTAVSGTYADSVKVKVAAPPEGGRANEACAELLAGVLGVKPAAVELVSGSSSRSKRFAVTGVAEADVRRRLADAVAEAGGGRARTPGGPGRR